MKRCSILLVVALMSGLAQAALVHQWNFDNGTANDSVGTAHGALMNGATIAGGQAVLGGGTGAAGAFVNLPGPAIAINTYPAITMELWSTQDTVDQGFSMTAAFGDAWGNGTGKNYINIATSRGDNVSRGAIAITPDQDSPWVDEVGVNGPELNDATQHQYVFTVTNAAIAFYIDGIPMGTAVNVDDPISGLSNTNGYLGKGVYPNDGTERCTINLFNLYNSAMTEAQVIASFAAGPVAIPEPATLLLLGLGGLALRRRRG